MRNYKVVQVTRALLHARCHANGGKTAACGIFWYGFKFQDVFRVCALNCLQIFRMTMCQLWKGNHFAAVSWRQLFVAAAYWSTWSHLANLGATEDSTIYPSQINFSCVPTRRGQNLIVEYDRLKRRVWLWLWEPKGWPCLEDSWNLFFPSLI